MKTKRVIALLLVLAAIFLCLASCSPKGNGDNTSSTSGTTELVKKDYASELKLNMSSETKKAGCYRKNIC